MPAEVEIGSVDKSRQSTAIEVRDDDFTGFSL
jgi:hypothetical protein